MSRVALLGLVLSCTGEPAAPSANHASVAATPVGCPPATLPPGVLVHVSRHVLPIGESPRVEHAAITHDGTCPSDLPCKVVSAAELAKVWQAVAGATALEHGAAATSPHYGGRFIAIAWPGGRCELGDSSEAPLVAASLPKFGAAFDAVVAAFLAHS